MASNISSGSCSVFKQLIIHGLEHLNSSITELKQLQDSEPEQHIKTLYKHQITSKVKQKEVIQKAYNELLDCGCLGE